MTDAPVQVVVAAFADKNGAAEALSDLKEAQEHGLITIRDAAIVQCDNRGEVHIEGTGHRGVGRGAIIGGVAGAIVGLLTGPVGWATGGGAVVGALASRLRDSGFPEDRLQQLGDALQPDTSAVVAVIDQTWLKEITELLAKKASDMASEIIQADIARQLEAGRDVAYTALSMADRTVGERVTADDYTTSQKPSGPVDRTAAD
jgi:uncharacterized membrane protein